MNWGYNVVPIVLIGYMVDIKTGLPQQEEIVLATVQGKDVTSMPEDLYVPPNSLKILLDTFSGPLDFLLYLIRKQNLDVLDIDVFKITEQYISELGHYGDVGAGEN